MLFPKISVDTSAISYSISYNIYVLCIILYNIYIYLLIKLDQLRTALHNT